MHGNETQPSIARVPRQRVKLPTAAAPHLPVYSYKRPATNEEDVGGVQLHGAALADVGALFPALFRHGHHSALQHLEQRLLHALPRHVPRDTHPHVALADFVDLVNIYDT